jgi:hypothetical protein
VKLKQLFLCITGLLFTSLLPAKVYADQSSQTMGSNNTNSPQINGNGNTVCNNCNIYNSETTPNINQPNLVPEKTKTTNSLDGLIPKPNPDPEITNSLDGLIPKPKPDPEITNSLDGLIPTQNPDPEIPNSLDGLIPKLNPKIYTNPKMSTD